MQAAAVFHWKSLRRQVRIRGAVTIVSDAEADAYFASRPRDSRIGAWASAPSRPGESRFALEPAVANYSPKHAIAPAPRAPTWSGLTGGRWCRATRCRSGYVSVGAGSL